MCGHMPFSLHYLMAFICVVNPLLSALPKGLYMCGHVPSKVALAGEPSPTHLADKGSLPRVDPSVLLEIVVVRESLATKLAHKVTLSG